MEAHIFLKEVHLLILVIAEKPSVAQSIAKVLGATSRKDGYNDTSVSLQYKGRLGAILGGVRVP